MDDLSFEELMERLNKNAQILEKGHLGLEVSMRTYEEGIALIRKAEEKLKNAEKKIEEILSDGTVQELKLESL